MTFPKKSGLHRSGLVPRVYGTITLNNTQFRTLRATGTVLPADTDVYTSTMNALVELDQQQPPLSASAAAK